MSLVSSVKTNAQALANPMGFRCPHTAMNTAITIRSTHTLIILWALAPCTPNLKTNSANSDHTGPDPTQVP